MAFDTHGAEGAPWIGFDLDGTLAVYDKWRGVDHIGEPVKPMCDLIKKLHDDGKSVKILTARVAPKDDGSDSDVARAYIEKWCADNLGFIPPITHEKDALMEMLYDDRVKAVEQNTGRVLNVKSTNPIVANAIRAANPTRNAAIVIKPSPSADTRTADHVITEEELRKSTEMHIDDVRKGLAYLSKLLKERGERHDWTKLRYMPSFYKQFREAQKTGCWGNGWYDKIHTKQERHHIEDACPKDVNLLDVLEHIVDGVMAGLARSGEYRQDIIGAGILERAYANTQRLLRDAVRIDP